LDNVATVVRKAAGFAAYGFSVLGVLVPGAKIIDESSGCKSSAGGLKFLYPASGRE